MRMWMIPPDQLCRKHLLVEHFEIHKHRHVFLKKQSISGRIEPVTQIEPVSMENRHNELVNEMIIRGMNHASPYDQPDISYLPISEQFAKVHIDQSYKDLISRCEAIKKII
ncbi:MAG: pyrimidine dimer DNA glycosylase/endonuclease V [Novosphingobium sp.]|nr:pyrimidine dimer DNA glycosylase/endonuclease V [Novosphingobium sp.]